MSTDDKFGLADRLRDSAALIKDQIGGGEGDAVYLDLELLADEIEEMESSFEGGGAGFLTLGDGQVQSSTGQPGQNGYHTLTTRRSVTQNRGKKRQQANKK